MFVVKIVAFQFTINRLGNLPSLNKLDFVVRINKEIFSEVADIELNLHGIEL